MDFVWSGKSGISSWRSAVTGIRNTGDGYRQPRRSLSPVEAQRALVGPLVSLRVDCPTVLPRSGRLHAALMPALHA